MEILTVKNATLFLVTQEWLMKFQACTHYYQAKKLLPKEFKHLFLPRDMAQRGCLQVGDYLGFEKAHYSCFDLHHFRKCSLKNIQEHMAAVKAYAIEDAKSNVNDVHSANGILYSVDDIIYSVEPLAGKVVADPDFVPLVLADLEEEYSTDIRQLLEQPTYTEVISWEHKVTGKHLGVTFIVNAALAKKGMVFDTISKKEGSEQLDILLFSPETGWQMTVDSIDSIGGTPRMFWGGYRHTANLRISPFDMAVLLCKKFDPL